MTIPRNLGAFADNINSSGKVAIAGISPNGSTSGQVLTSAGSGSDPTWSTPATGIPSQTGNAGKYLTTDGSNASWATVGGSSYTVKTANYTAVSGDNILANTSSGSFTVTLPSSPTTGSLINIADGAGTFNINPLIVARNGSTIMSIAEDMFLSTVGASTGLVFNGSTWRIV